MHRMLLLAATAICSNFGQRKKKTTLNKQYAIEYGVYTCSGKPRGKQVVLLTLCLEGRGESRKKLAIVFSEQTYVCVC